MEKIIKKFFEDNNIKEPDKINFEGIKKYIAYYKKWNKHYNISSIKSDEAILEKHFLDSFALNHFISKGVVVDIGSGGGFPGLALKLVNENIKLWSIDKCRKKISFQKMVCAQLDFKEVFFHEGDLKSFIYKENINFFVFRAVDKIETIFDWIYENLENATAIYMTSNAEFKHVRAGAFKYEFKTYELPYSKQIHKLIKIKKESK